MPITRAHFLPLTVFVSLCLATGRLSAQSPASKPAVHATGEVEKIQDGFQFTEGPAQDAAGNIYFTDIPANQIWRWQPGRDAVAFIEPSRHANGLLAEAGGKLVACQMDGQVVAYDLKSKAATVLANAYEGKRFNAPNDLIIDAEGGVYFTDPLFRAPEPLPQGVQAVYYIGVDGTVTRVTDDLPAPNGVALSPDGKRLYVIPSRSSKMLVYDVEAPGKLTNGRPFCTLQQRNSGDDSGGDGMVVDSEGNLYITANTGVQVFSADGTFITNFEFPEQPANVTFGGTARDTLFVTARNGFYRLPINKTGLTPGRLQIEK